MFFNKGGHREATGSQLGPSWAPKGPKMTPQEGPKTAPKSTKIEVQKRSKKEARSKRHQMHILGPARRNARAHGEGIWEGEEGSWPKIWSKKWRDLQKWTIELGDLEN